MTQFDTPDDDATQPFSDPGAPPTTPGQLAVPPRRSSWPIVLGIIAIVFGALGALGELCGIAAPFMTGWFSGFMPPGQPTGFEAWEGNEYYIVASAAIGLLLAVMLLVGGTMLLRRRAAAARVLIYWSIAKIIYVIPAIIFEFMMQQEQFNHTMQAMPAQPGAGSSGMPQTMFTTIMVVSVVLGILWLWALPVFLLIWLNRRKIKDEMLEWA